MDQVPLSEVPPQKSGVAKSVLIGVVVLALIAAGFFLFKGKDKANDSQNTQTPPPGNTSQTPTPTPTPASTTPVASLTLVPAAKTVKVGETIAVDLVLDTAGGPIDAVDIYALNYDPKLLQVVDDVSSQSGVQIMAGKILSVNGPNLVDAKAGTIKLGQAAPGGTNYKGKGVLATVHFKALAAGSAELKFDFTPGKTTDTNAAYDGKDQLSVAAGTTITVTAN